MVLFFVQVQHGPPRDQPTSSLFRPVDTGLHCPPTPCSWSQVHPCTPTAWCMWAVEAGICWAEKAARWLIPRGPCYTWTQEQMSEIRVCNNQKIPETLPDPNFLGFQFLTWETWNFIMLIVFIFVQVQHGPRGISQWAAFSAQQIPASTAHLHHAIGLRL